MNCVRVDMCPNLTQDLYQCTPKYLIVYKYILCSVGK